MLGYAVGEGQCFELLCQSCRVHANAGAGRFHDAFGVKDIDRGNHIPGCD